MRVMQMLDVSGATNTYDSGDLATGFTSTDCNTIYLINMSDLCYNVTFTGGSGPPVIGHLPNNWARPFKVNGNYNSFRITGSNNPTGAGTAAFSHIVVESYYPNEDVSHLTDTPIPIPNTPQVNVTTAEYLSNTADPYGTSIINVKPAASSFPAFNVYNDGTLQIDDPAVPANLMSCYPGVANGQANVILSDTLHQTEVKGSLLVDGTTTLAGGFVITATLDLTGIVSGNSITVGSQPIASNSANNLVFNTGGATRNILFRVNSATVMTVLSNAIQMNQPLQVNTINSFGVNDIIINPTNAASNILLEIAGGLIAQIATNFVGLSQILNANGGIGVGAGASNNISMAAGSGLLALNQSAFATVNGSVSGVCNLYTALWGTSLKIGIFQMLSNYQTAVAQTLLFPSAIQFAMVYSGSIGPNTVIQFNNGGSAAPMRCVTAFGVANTAGTDASQSAFHQLQIGQFGVSDRLLINTTGGNNINSFGFFIGQ
jgi:hypothetical protein